VPLRLPLTKGAVSRAKVPAATLTGLGQTGTSFCGLFGTTVPLPADAIKARYGDHDTYVKRFTDSLDKAVAAKTILEADAARLRTVVTASDIAR
jgi:hypothetical protein